jgi:hypothetical protein
MISKSQFVIFSALLAYQGMVGAPDSSKVTQNPKGAVPAKKQVRIFVFSHNLTFSQLSRNSRRPSKKS